LGPAAENEIAIHIEFNKSDVFVKLIKEKPHSTSDEEKPETLSLPVGACKETALHE
jgi:hypothetical protein